ARIANDGLGPNAAQAKRWEREARRADRDVDATRDLLDTDCDFYYRSISLQLGGEDAEPLRVARAKHHAFDQRRQAAGTARTHVPCCSNDEERRSRDLPSFQCTHLPDA